MRRFLLLVVLCGLALGLSLDTQRGRRPGRIVPPIVAPEGPSSDSSTACADAETAGTAKYVRAGAGGSASGDDWTNAYTVLPASLTRDWTYCIADGSYSAYTFDDAVDGTELITIAKATVDDHGTATGWDNAYGDGQAIFTAVNFQTSYWVFDGKVGGGPGSWTSGHGFRIYNGTISDTIVMGQTGGSAISNITLRHVEAEGQGDDGAPVGDNDTLAMYDPVSAVTLSYLYLHDAGRTLIFARASDVVVEYSYFGAFESDTSEHAEAASLGNPTGFESDNWTIRWSVFTHGEGTGGVLINGSNLTIHGSVFVRLAGSVWTGNGAVATWSWSVTTGWNVYNCSFIDVAIPIGDQAETPSTGSFRNNVFYSTSTPASGGLTHTHNHYVDTTEPSGETNGSSGTGDPFTDYLNLDFRLVGGTTAGVDLGAPYNVDMFGNTRGADGTWDRGAVEFEGP